MTQSSQYFDKAQQFIPGGVNSPVRAYKAVGGVPPFIERAEGAYLFDVDGNRYIDYVGSWGPMIMGHNHPAVLQAVINKASMGLSFGAPTAIEVEMAELLCDLVPSLEMVRMVSSGTEATMSAIRLARGYTHRDNFIKFEGCYHGHADCLLVQAGSGALTFGEPNSPGIPEDFAKHTLVAQYNDLDSVKVLFEQQPDAIAAIIVEPVAGNMNCIPPQEGFLEGLRALCDQYGAVLIFDEVMTGFRVALGGAQQHYDVMPDLTTLGKIVGGGMPVGAFGGKKIMMEHLAPSGPIYQAGTLSGNPVAMAAGLAALKIIQEPRFYQNIVEKVSHLTHGLKQAAKAHGIGLCTNQVGGMFGIFFTDQLEVRNFDEVKKCHVEQFNQFFNGLLKNGIYLAPSAFEAAFMSSAHTDENIENTIKIASEVFASMK